MSNVTAYGKDFAFLRNLAQEKVTRLCIYGCGVNGEVISKFLESCGKNIEFLSISRRNVENLRFWVGVLFLRLPF